MHYSTHACLIYKIEIKTIVQCTLQQRIQESSTTLPMQRVFGCLVLLPIYFLQIFLSDRNRTQIAGRQVNLLYGQNKFDSCFVIEFIFRALCGHCHIHSTRPQWWVGLLAILICTPSL